MLLRKTCSGHRETYAYLDPKCFNDNDSKRDEKSDIFSLGIVLWEISSREYPCGEFKDIFDIQSYRLNGGRHDVVPGTPEEYKNLYTECWDDNSERRPTGEQCYHRLKNILGEVNQLPKCDSNHLLSNELSVLYSKLNFKGGKSMERIADYINNWLKQDNNKQESSLVTLKAHANCGQCFWLIGFFYAHGIETETDLEQAFQWYQQSSMADNAVAQCSLGVCYEDGTGVEKNIQKAVELYQKAAGQGYAEAQYNLGVCYANGTGVEKNIQKAVELHQKAAEQGYAVAQYNLGVFYENGTGVEKNIQKAVELYQKAAKQEVAWAQYNLGLCYAKGTGVEKNIQKAVELYQKAANQGYVRAQYNLGLCYECGTGVEEYIQKAVGLYQRAARQGHSGAQFNLGLCYEYGKGVEKNIQKAVELYQKVAEQGDARAQNKLGDLL